MNKRIFALLIVFLLLSICAGCAAAPTEVELPAHVPTPTPVTTPAPTPEPTPPPEVALLVSCGNIDHPLLKPYLLGITDACQRLGIEDITFMDYYSIDYKYIDDTILQWMDDREGKLLGVVHDGHLSHYDFVKELKARNGCLSSFCLFYDTDYEYHTYENDDFAVGYDKSIWGEDGAYDLLEATDGKSGNILLAWANLNSVFDSEETTFYSIMADYQQNDPAIFDDRTFETVGGKGSESFDTYLKGGAPLGIYVSQTKDITEFAEFKESNGYNDMYLAGSSHLTREVLDYCEAGVIDHLNLSNMYNIADALISLTYDHLNGKPSSGPVLIENDTITPETKEELIPKLREQLARAETIDVSRYMHIFEQA